MNIFIRSFWIFIHFIIIFILIPNWDTINAISNKKRVRNAHHRAEDYSFESELDRATEECSYVTLNNSLLNKNKNKTIQEIKNEINNRRVMEFYRQREEEKRRSKEYYENIERESRRRILFGNLNPGWMIQAQGQSPASPILPSAPPIPPIMDRNLFKRSPRTRDPDRRFRNSFNYGSFRDHNNCTSRCIFSRMAMVSPKKKKKLKNDSVRIIRPSGNFLWSII